MIDRKIDYGQARRSSLSYISRDERNDAFFDELETRTHARAHCVGVVWMVSGIACPYMLALYYVLLSLSLAFIPRARVSVPKLS